MQSRPPFGCQGCIAVFCCDSLRSHFRSFFSCALLGRGGQIAAVFLRLRERSACGLDCKLDGLRSQIRVKMNVEAAGHAIKAPIRLPGPFHSLHACMPDGFTTPFYSVPRFSTKLSVSHSF